MLQPFYDNNIMFERKKKSYNRETLRKHVTGQNHSVIAKLRILQGLKG